MAGSARQEVSEYTTIAIQTYMFIRLSFVLTLRMDDFEKDFPDFDWKNTPAYKHPGGKDCPCPKHEYIREQIKVAKTVSENNKDISPEYRQKAQVTLKGQSSTKSGQS